MEGGMSGDYRHMSSGSLSIPTGLGPQNGTGNGQPQNMGAVATGPRFDGPRSPPGKQNTSHVPCKFFRQGACQAGKACPFSHDLASTTDNVCKYFAKGNCKFGPKCANIHVLPDGRRVNYNKNGPIGIGGSHLNIGGRVDPGVYHGQSTLTNSFMRANLTSSPYASYPTFAQAQEDGFPPLGSRSGGDFGIPTIDASYATGSNYGSPREEEFMNRAGLGLSPVTNKGLSVLDAPLPSSFDSNGVSWYAKNVSAPMAASVPSKFGFESPPQSLSSIKDGRTSDALAKLRSSAFGDDTTRDRFNGIAASPPAAATEEYFGKRPMHSQRTTKQSIMSASLPKSTYPIDRDWESDFTYEEDFIPDSLQELLTPQEKARRGSRAADDGTYSGAGTPGDTSSKVGSPSNASPSRWGPLFQRQQREEEEKASRTSAFGHVGSPLRNSSLHLGSSPGARASPRAGNTPGDSSPYLASPPRQSSMSIISQQLQRTRLAQSSSAEQPGLHPATATARAPSNPIGTRREVDRQMSSSSIGTGRLTTPIDEEQGDFVFSMEEEEDAKSKRNSGGWSYPVGGRSPHLSGTSKGTNGNANGNVSGGGMEGIFGVGR